jgi:predicted transcriptional regulator
MTSPTADYHLKKLIENQVIYKDVNHRYALTILGESILDYFHKFFTEVENIGKILSDNID